MKLHINLREEVIWAFDTGKPIAALCGYTRTVSERRHDMNIQSGKLCRRCKRVLDAMISTGQASQPVRKTAAELRLPTPSPWNGTVTFTMHSRVNYANGPES